MTTGWREYFDSLKNESPLYRVQAAVYVDSLRAAVGVQHHQRVLDFGCGFGFVTSLLAPFVDEIWWWDPSNNMRATAERNTAGLANAKFCDLSAMLAAGPRGSLCHAMPFDLILVNSVLQYMSPAEIWKWLGQWRSMLSPKGRVVLSDLIPPGHSSLSDLLCLIRLGRRHGSVLMATNDALGGLSNYWRTRHALPLTSVSKTDLVRQARGAGLDVSFLPGNLTHFSKRWAAVLQHGTPLADH